MNIYSTLKLEPIMWGTDSEVTLIIPTSWYSCPGSLPLSVGGTYDLLLASRIWQRQWDACNYKNMVTIHETATSDLLRDSLSYWL